MAREIFYTYSASGVPADPTVNSTKYTAPLAYANGYYKAIAREGGELSSVTSKSFGVAPTDYIAYYSFDGNTNDATGNYNLTNNGATLTTGKDGVPNTAYSFNGTSNGMKNSIGVMSNKTYSFYYKTADINTHRCIIYYSNNDGAGSGTADTVKLQSGNIVVYAYDGSPKVMSSTAIANSWTHVVVSFQDNGYVKLYINKVNVAEMTIGSRWTGGDRHWIGQVSAEFGSAYYLGDFDNFYIFNRILTQDEINSL